jgi:hypothetical protein
MKKIERVALPILAVCAFVLGILVVYHLPHLQTHNRWMLIGEVYPQHCVIVDFDMDEWAVCQGKNGEAIIHDDFYEFADQFAK